MSGYVRMGRGGAGNHIPKEELQKQTQDLEAQETAAPDKHSSTANQLAQEELASPPPGEYKHMGRGGAGNFFVPADLAERGTTLAQDEDPTDDSVAGLVGAGTAATAKPVPRQWLGRGGAGNFAGAYEDGGDAAPRIEEFELQERERAQALQDQVRRCVDAQLPRPGLAHLGGSYREE